MTQVDQLVTSQSANLGCIFHDSADVLSNLAQSTNLTNLSQGLAENQSFFGAINRVAAPGLAKATTSGAAGNPSQLFLRTRLEIPPIISPAASTYASPNQIPDVLPGAGCVTVNGNGVGPATQAGFVPAAGGRVVAPTSQEADVELQRCGPPFQQRRLRHPGLESVGAPGRGGRSGAGAPAGVGGQAGSPPGPTPMMRHRSRS